jgi:malic enzyme
VLAAPPPDEIVRTVEAIAPAFGGINLEDRSKAPEGVSAKRAST